MSAESATVYEEELRRVDAIDKMMRSHQTDGTDEHGGEGREIVAGEEDPGLRYATLYEGSRASASRRIDKPNEELRSRDTSGSHPRSRSIKIVDLPSEILILIFSSFQHSAMVNNRIDVEDIDNSFGEVRFKTVQSLRRVCRLFNDIASPFLIPIIRVQIDEPSMHRIERILKNPSLAAGLRVIQARVGYRFKAFALDKEQFVRFHREDVALKLKAQEHREWRETRLRSGRRNHMGKKRRSSINYLLNPLVINLKSLLAACDRCLNPGENYTISKYGLFSSDHQSSEDEGSSDADSFDDIWPADVQENMIKEYQKVIDVAYESYQRKYTDQCRLVSEKSFVNALGKLVSSPRRFVSLSIIDIPYWTKLENRNLHIDGQVVRRSLERPQRWTDIGYICEYMNVDRRSIQDDLNMQTMVIWDLPIALHRSGSTLYSFELNCLLTSKEYTTPCPLEISLPDSPIWGQLRTACENLQVFLLDGLAWEYYRLPNDLNVVGHHRGTRHPLNPPNGGVSIEKYLDTVLSSQVIRRILLRPLTSMRLGFKITRPPFWFGDILAHARWHCLEELSMWNISATQEQIELFCNNLSTEISDLDLNRVNLTQGSWVGVLDVLRDRLKQRCQEDKCCVNIDALLGDEIVNLIVANANITETRPDTWREELDDEENLMGSFVDYISSDRVTKNPAILPN